MLTRRFAEATSGDEAHERAFHSATGLACVGLKVLQDGDFLKKAQKYWKEDMKKAKEE
jgi:hypothetical protein